MLNPARHIVQLATDKGKEQMKEKNTSDLSLGLQRRKVLGWVGLGVAGAFAIKALPMKFISKRIERKNKVKVSINELAVKRNKKVTRHG